MSDLPDGTLHSWDEIATKHNWETLLIGNGLSRHVWDPFGYPKLFDHASAAALTDQDRAIFEGSPNFERALGDLLTAIRVCSVSGMDTAPLYERYRNIQQALGGAVRAVHINRDAVPGETRQAISENPDRAIAVSMLPGGTKAARLAQQMEIYGRVEVKKLLFFDAATYPLGLPELKVTVPG